MNKALIWICFIFISGIHCFAQRQFSAILSSFESEGQKRIVALEDGGYVTKEIDADWNAEQAYIVLSRFNACSQEIWSKKFDGLGMALSNPGQDSLNLLNALYLSLNFTETADHGFLLIYNSYVPVYLRPPFIGQDIPMITKLDSSGNVQWSRRINPIINPDYSGRYPVLQSCAATRDGGGAILGYSDSINRAGTLQDNSRSIFLMRLDGTGKIAWSKIYRLQDSLIYSSLTSFGELQSLQDGGFIFNYIDESSGTLILYRIDNNGNMRWEKYLSKGLNSGSQESHPLVSVEDAGKNIYISGTSYITGDTDIHISTSGITSPLTAGLSPFLLKLDSNGKLKWFDGYFDPTGLGKFTANIDLIIGKENNPVLISDPYADHSYRPEYQFYILSTDTSGKPLWNKGSGYKTGGIYNNIAEYSDYFECHATTDSGLIFMETAQDSIYSQILKLDKNGLSGCIESDIPVKRVSSNIAITNAILSPPAAGFTISDTTATVKNIREKAKMVCSDHLIPQADISPDTVLCSGQSYTLYKGAQNAGAKTYWSTGDTTDSIVISKSGKYWLQLSYGYCTSADTVTIIFKSLIKTGLPKTESICPYDTVLLSVKDTITSYYWITPKRVTIQGRSVMAKDSGYYYLMLNGTQCPNVDTVHITYYPLPNASAGPDTTLCYNETYTMQGSGGLTYTWHPATYLSSSTDPKAIAKLPNTEQYILVVRNAYGCEDSSPVLLKVRPPLMVKAIVNNASVCYGQSIVFSAMASGGDSLHYQFNWTSDNLSGDSISEKVYHNGWHKIILSDNCSAQNATDSVYVIVTPPAKAAFTTIPATKILANHNVSFQNQSTNASYYLWTFGTKDSSKLVSPVYVYTDTGDYEVVLVAYGINNCPNDTAYGFIKIISDQITIYIPNAFSPNGDGINDFFDISGVGIQSYTYNIYNRWGENIYTGTNAWDGTFKGVQVPDGVYIYMFDITDVFGEHHYLSGNVTLMR